MNLIELPEFSIFIPALDTVKQQGSSFDGEPISGKYIHGIQLRTEVATPNNGATEPLNISSITGLISFNGGIGIPSGNYTYQDTVVFPKPIRVLSDLTNFSIGFKVCLALAMATEDVTINCITTLFFSDQPTNVIPSKLQTSLYR